MVVWNKLYHRSIFAHLRFAEGKLNEDTLLIAYAYEKADRIANIPDALYLYRKVAGSKMCIRDRCRTHRRAACRHGSCGCCCRCRSPGSGR